MSHELSLTAAQAINERRAALTEAITARHYELQPALAERYGEGGREKCRQDAGYHLAYLSGAMAASMPSLFADYVAWAKVMLAGRGIPAEDLVDNLQVLRDTLDQQLPAPMQAVVHEYVEAGLKQLPQLPAALPSLIGEGQPLGGLARQYLDALLAGERQRASRLVLEAVERGVEVKEIYLHVFQRAQHEIGRLWQMNRLSVAQEHYCTAATQLIMSQLYPRVFAGERNGRTLVATCVAGDLHEIGVRMVADFFEMEGWDTFYLGANTPTPGVLQTIAERRADLVAVSATLTTHVPEVVALVAALRASAACRGVKILVGGHPFNVAPELWKQVGADGCARDATESVALAGRLVTNGARP